MNRRERKRREEIQRKQRKDLEEKREFSKKNQEKVRFTDKEYWHVSRRRAIKELNRIEATQLGKPVVKDIVSPAEKKLRLTLIENGVRCEPQARIGKYSIDFVLPGKVAVEVDGVYHESKTAKDLEKTKYLEERGYLVLRIPAHDAYNETTASMIKKICAERLKRQ